MISLLFTTVLLVAPAQDAGASSAEALVERIREELEAVDRALAEASEAEAVSGELEAAREAHLAVIRDIESLIRQVKYRRNPQQSGGGPSQQQQQSQQMEGQPQPRPSDAQQAPEPQPGQRETSGEPQDQQGEQEQPEGGGPDASLPRQERGDRPPPPDETGRFTRPDTDARWGLLPPKIQERLMNLHVDDVPERYRAWMDAYIRELNRLEQEP
jgi:hypothetical protein